MKAIGAGTFFSYSQICLQKHGVELYTQEFLGIQGFFIWVAPLVFALLVMFESNYFCLFHVRGQGLNTVRYAPLMGLGLELGMTEQASSDEAGGGDVELTHTRNSLRQGSELDEEEMGGAAGEGQLNSLPAAHDDGEDEDEDEEDEIGHSSQHGMISGTVTDRGSPRHSARDSAMLAEMRARLAEEGGFPLLPALCIACLEGFAVGFEVGDVSRGQPQFMWSYLHLIFNKTMLAVSWAALLQAKLGGTKEYLTLLSILLLGASTPAGILIGQLYHKVLDSSVLRQPVLLDTMFCAASGLYMYLAAFTLADDWKQRKVTGVLAAVAVAVVSNIYLDV